MLTFRGAPDERSTAHYALAADEVAFPSRDGTRLSGWWIRPSDGVRRRDLAVVVLVHDIAGSRADLLPNAARLARAGFLVLDLDLRAHGASDGGRTTGGFDEADDVASAVAFARARAIGAPVALYGVGMGGTACVTVCLRDPTLAYTFVSEAGGSYESNLLRRTDGKRGSFGVLAIPWLVDWRVESTVRRGFRLQTRMMTEGLSLLGERRFAIIGPSSEGTIGSLPRLETFDDAVETLERSLETSSR